MERTDNYGSEYLRAEDLLYEGKFHTVQVTIEEVIPAGTIKTAEKKVIPHPTLRFVGKRKLLVLCSKTNQRMVRYWSGKEPEESAGTTITIQPRVVPFGNKKDAELVLAIRILPPSGTVISKSLIKHLGQEAVWTPPENQKKPPTTKEPEPTEFEKLLVRISAKTQEQAVADYATVMEYCTKQKDAGLITEEQLSKLGAALNAIAAPESEAK
jgi:hypothetical protein